MVLFVVQWLSIGKFWSCCCLSFHWLFVNSQRDVPFHHIAYDYFCADWDGLHDHLKDVPREDTFKVSASAVTSEFCEWVLVEIDLYMLHCKYHVKPHSSSWFSAVFAAPIVHRNHFFRLYQQKKSSESKVTFRHASNCWAIPYQIIKFF